MPIKIRPIALTFILTFAALTATRAAAQTYTYSSLVDFPPASQLGPVNPTPITAIDAQGNLYGTSNGGGLNNYGTVFEVSSAGVLTVLHSFSGLDGKYPATGVNRDSAGNLYGVTVNGGPGTFKGHGVLYKVAPDGTETVLYDFPNKPPYGNYPATDLLVVGNGDLLGYTSFSQSDGLAANGGSIFKFTQPNSFKIMYTFAELGYGNNGVGPLDGLIQDSSGNYYGATGYQGSGGDGTVFKLTPGGKITVLYSFNVFKDPVQAPQGPLVQDAAGNLYGVGQQGIYEVLAGGGEKVVYLFPQFVHGKPIIINDSAGNIYGTTTLTVYRVSPQGVETDLYVSTTGIGSGLVMDQAGNLYGTEYAGGANGTGQVFKLTKSN